MTLEVNTAAKKREKYNEAKRKDKRKQTRTLIEGELWILDFLKPQMFQTSFSISHASGLKTWSTKQSLLAAAPFCCLTSPLFHGTPISAPIQRHTRPRFLFNKRMLRLCKRKSQVRRQSRDTKAKDGIVLCLVFTLGLEQLCIVYATFSACKMSACG